jgi:membrane fusion protein (multidrug efflux system)
MTMSETSPATETASKPPPPPAHAPKRKPWPKIVAIIVIVALLFASIPWVIEEVHTVSTDDAYVNGHVTFVAPRVGGQVTHVYVDDNNRVRKGDLLVQLDKEPYEVALNIAEAAVAAAQADLTAAQAQARASEGQIRSLRFNLDHAIESVDDQIAQLRSAVATLQSKKATLAKTQADYDRAVPLLKSGAVAQEDFDRRTEARLVAEAEVEEALQHVYELRVSLGLPAKPASGDDLASVPEDLDQTFSTVRQAQASLIQAAAQLGYNESFNITPKQMYANFYKQDPEGNIDKIYADLLKKVPAIKQAQAKLAETQRDLDQAKLNLRYTDVFAEIDGVITRRDVNPGNNVIAGQSLMAIRSLTDIWIDANFKETQLASLRIGQPADLDVDMYGSKQTFNGRISGFTMGTGSTLALLPAENATGNFVKVVQRLPVRIDLVDYDPDKIPLFIGLSVTPRVHINEEPTGPNAGEYLQPYLAITTQPSAIEPTTQP